MKFLTFLSILLMLLSVLISGGCTPSYDFSDDEAGAAGFDAAQFQTTVDNPYFILTPGTVKTFAGEEDGAALSVETEVLAETAVVAGVTCTVLRETEYEEGELKEISWNWFAQDKDTGDVYYFGEAVDSYEDGEVVGHEGAWKVGDQAAAPGLIFPGDPQLGDVFNPESVPDITEETAEIIEVGLTYDTPYGQFTDVIKVEEHSAGEDAAEWKLYAPNVGLIAEEYESGSMPLTGLTK